MRDYLKVWNLFSWISLIVLTFNVQAKEHEEYIVGVEAFNYSPVFWNDRGIYRGFSRALLDEFARDHGITFVYRPLPVKRLFHTFLETDELDFKFPDNSRWAMNAKIDRGVLYSDPVLEFVSGSMVRPERIGLSVFDLKSLVTVIGFTPLKYQKLIDSGSLALVEVDSFEQAIRMTIMGRSDAVYGSVAVLRHFLQESQFTSSQLVFDDALPSTRDQYHLSTRKHIKLIYRFNLWLESETEKVQALKERYRVLFYGTQ